MNDRRRLVFECEISETDIEIESQTEIKNGTRWILNKTPSDDEYALIGKYRIAIERCESSDKEVNTYWFVDKLIKNSLNELIWSPFTNLNEFILKLLFKKAVLKIARNTEVFA